MKLKTFVVSLLTAAGAGIVVAQSANLASEGKAWWAHVQFLADDKLEGRNVGTPGFDKAVDYVESQFKAIGLKPAGTNGYRQPLKLDSRTLVPEQTSLVLVRDGKEQPLVVGQDATLSARGEFDGSMEAAMVFVGYGMSIPEASWDDFAGQNLKGKIAVYVNQFPPVKVSDNVRSHVNTADERWLALKRAGAIGVATLALPRAQAAPAPTPAAAAPATPPAQAGATGAGRGGLATQPAPVITLFDRELVDAAGQALAMNITARGAAAILAGSGHTAEELAQLVSDAKPLPRFALPGTLKARASLKRETIETTNVAGMFEGSDPTLKSEYVVMTAHLDHVGIGRAVNGDSIYNGAMDDASGVAAVIETARLLTASGVKTKRSVVFVAVTAEEKGLLGSRYFTGKPTVPFKQIVARRVRARGGEDDGCRGADGSGAGTEPLHPQRSIQLHPQGRACTGVQVRLRVRIA